jgi:diguanylate cyclase (GGDEF)-like protein/PAS domain S-box-containing protein
MGPDLVTPPDVPPRVLLADDDPVILATLAAQLEPAFAVISKARDADRAIALAGEHQPDVAIVDVEMPGGGLSATRGIRAVSPATAIVILTADDARSSVLQFLDAGATAYLRKGMSSDRLAPRLLEALTGHRSLVASLSGQSRADDRFQAAFQQAAAGMAIVALEGPEAGQLVVANAAFAEMIGRTADDLTGTNPEQWTHPPDLPDGFSDPLSVLARGLLYQTGFEQRYVHADGHLISAVGTAASFVDEDSRRVAIIQLLDISERKRHERELEYLADHDALTGQFNRRRFAAELARELARIQRYGGRGALVVLDLDGFKSVNDSLGHAAGDELIAALANGMRHTLRESDVFARTGGDEFAALLPEADTEAAQVVCEKLLAVIRRAGAISRGDRHARVTTSIGVALFEARERRTAEDLLVEADIAMYDAKKAGKDRACVYRSDSPPSDSPRSDSPRSDSPRSDSPRSDSPRREQTGHAHGSEARPHEAFDEKRFVLHAQAIVPVRSSGVPRFELLLRMADSHGALLPPGAVLREAERSDLIQGIDRWVVAQAASTLHDHHARGHDLSLAVNVSGRTLNAGVIAEQVRLLTRRYAFPEDRLVIELKETAAIASLERARELARDLHRLGCRLALDDFGASPGGFSQLKDLDFDLIKIDGEFIRRLSETRCDQLVVQAIVDIARGLGKDTVAEFVQNQETLALLRDIGVGYAQGHYTGLPGPLESVLAGVESKPDPLPTD